MDTTRRSKYHPPAPRGWRRGSLLTTYRGRTQKCTSISFNFCFAEIEFRRRRSCCVHDKVCSSRADDGSAAYPDPKHNKTENLSLYTVVHVEYSRRAEDSHPFGVGLRHTTFIASRRCFWTGLLGPSQLRHSLDTPPAAYRILPPLVSARTGELVLQENLLAHCEIPKERTFRPFDHVSNAGI